MIMNKQTSTVNEEWATPILPDPVAEFEGVIGSLQFTYEETEKQLDRLFTPVNEYFVVIISDGSVNICTDVGVDEANIISVTQIKEQGMNFGVHIREYRDGGENSFETMWEKTLKVLDEKSFYQTIKDNCSVFKQQVAFG